MSNLTIFKLLNNEDIIGVVENYSEEELKLIEKDYPSIICGDLIFLRDPMRMISEYDHSEERHHLALAKWMPFSNDETFVLNKSQIVTSGLPTDEVSEYYNEMWNVLFSELAEKLPENKESLKDSFLHTFLKEWEFNKAKDKKH